MANKNLGWNLKQMCFNVNYPDQPLVVYSWGSDPLWRAYFWNGLKPPPIGDVKSLVLIQIIEQKQIRILPCKKKQVLVLPKSYQNPIRILRILSKIPKTNKCAVFCWDFCSISLQTTKLKAQNAVKFDDLAVGFFGRPQDERKCPPIGQKRRRISRFGVTYGEDMFFGYKL